MGTILLLDKNVFLNALVGSSNLQNLQGYLHTYPPEKQKNTKQKIMNLKLYQAVNYKIQISKLSIGDQALDLMC